METGGWDVERKAKVELARSYGRIEGYGVGLYPAIAAVLGVSALWEAFEVINFPANEARIWEKIVQLGCAIL